ncbi:MAG: hypothetical protein ACRYGI_11650 [Janthinobacterium lividum]
MTWTIINTATAIIASIVAAYMLGAYPEKFNIFERVGMGAASAGMILRIGPIVGRATCQKSPFDDWSVTLLQVGFACYLMGRLHRHSWANFKAKMQARAYLRKRGKLP